MNNITKNSYLFIIFIITIIFTSSIYLINFVEFNIENKKNEKDDKLAINYRSPSVVVEKYASFTLPIITLISFFLGCYYISKALTIIGNGKGKYAGIYFIVTIAIILVTFNNTILSENRIKKYISGKKFSVIGMIMVLGISALFFGFIDNFGLKLGVEALDNKFLTLFLGPFSTDKRFKNEKKSIIRNLENMNNWVNGKWRAVLNQTLRFKEDIRRIKNPAIKDLMMDIDELTNSQGGLPLEIPKSVIENNLTHEYIKNIKNKYDVIDSSKAMLGNTFSNIIGALLSSALINLFTYMTKYDSSYTGDDDIDESFLVKNINRYLPFLEGLFICIGCIIPIFLHIAMSRDNYNTNNTKAWIVLGLISLLSCLMLFFSVKGVKEMTTNNKKKSIKKSLQDIKLRLDINDSKDKDLNNKIETFISDL
tara:strand:- start:701 stop:1969 length:1269 start_codon:yes stop_codon:yes gene_type:complete